MVEGQVLVLNKSWIVVNVASVKRAMGLLYQDLARAVHPEDYSIYDFNDWCDLSEYQKTSRMITTSNREIRVPEVIILNAFNGFFKREIRFSRRNIFERDRHTCQYCRKKLSKSELTIDHVIPQSKGGQDSWENLALACVKCNVRKSNRTPEQANMPLLKKTSEADLAARHGNQNTLRTTLQLATLHRHGVLGFRTPRIINHA